MPAPPGSDVKGIRIYDVKPLLVVAGSKAEILLVPNYNRAYALKFGAFLAKNDVTIDFSNGFIDNLTSKQDATAFSLKFIDVLGSAAEKGVSLFEGFSGGTAGREDSIEIYEFVFDEDGNLLEMRPTPIHRHGIPVNSGFVTGGGNVN